MELIIAWLFFAVIVGAIAGSKGRSGFGWFLLAILISPLIAGIFVLLMPATVQANQPAYAGPAAAVGVADELMKLGQLRDSGTISTVEYDRQRAILLPPRWGPGAQAGTGMECGKCHKPLSPAWRDRCNHCGAKYAEFEPVPRA